MPNHMRPRYPQCLQDSLAVGCLPFTTDRSLDPAAAAVAAPMIHDQPIAVRQAGPIEQRPERIGDEGAVDEDNRIAGAGLVIRDGHAINRNVGHADYLVSLVHNPEAPRRIASSGKADPARSGVGGCVAIGALALTEPWAVRASGPCATCSGRNASICVFTEGVLATRRWSRWSPTRSAFGRNSRLEVRANLNPR